MKLFPTKQKYFKLFDNQTETLNRLQRRTEKSKNLISKHTDKSFCGTIDGNKFKLISSTIGKGAFCVMTGEINTEKGYVNVEIHKVFRVFLSIFLCLPIIGFPILMLTGIEKFSPILILIVVLQVFIIRFFFIGLAFRYLSNYSLKILRDVLDIEWINNNTN
jgi:hypothetical protein